MKVIRDCTQIIGRVERGDLAVDLTREIDIVLQAVRDAAGPKTSAKGSVTLKLNFEVTGVNLEILGDITSKVPKRPRAASMYFLTKDGEISDEHPDQDDLFRAPRAVKDDSAA